jgi:hypothetical protein
MHLGIASSLAARVTRCYRVELLNSSGPTSIYVPRGNPGHVSSSSSRPSPTFVRFRLQGWKNPLEIHQAVQWACAAGTLHEVDVSVITNRLHPSIPVHHCSGATRLLAVECKDWKKSVSLAVGRQAEWMKGALRLRDYAIVSTSKRSVALQGFIRARGSGILYYPDRGHGSKRVFRAADSLGSRMVRKYGL